MSPTDDPVHQPATSRVPKCLQNLNFLNVGDSGLLLLGYSIFPDGIDGVAFYQ